MEDVTIELLSATPFVGQADVAGDPYEVSEKDRGRL